MLARSLNAVAACACLNAVQRQVLRLSQCDEPIPSPATMQPAPAPRRVVTVRGSAVARGAQLWATLGADAQALMGLRKAMYSLRGLAHWRALAAGSEAAWREHAPISYAEFVVGAAAHGGVSAEDVLLLATDFEMQMAAFRNPSFYAPVSPSATSGAVERTAATQEQPSRATASWEHGRCTGFAITDATHQGSRVPLRAEHGRRGGRLGRGAPRYCGALC